ncbi:MAG TPA: M24 family metallopeptidase [Solirubrobacteraceae bacterium]|nr:M24 family metallopeptidase [Solirubrobacteraceae bacterium]
MAPTSPYPRFSDREMARRWRAFEDAMAQREVGHAVLYGSERAGSAVGWLTRWPVTREALVVHTPGERPVLLINFYNHVPNAQRLATDLDVRWAGERAIDTAIGELGGRGAAGARIGVVGRLDHRAHAALAGLGAPVDMNADYTRLRLVKSDEEIEWLRVAAAMTDDAVRALHGAAAPGVSELELVDTVERAYVRRGGVTHIHYLASTPMARPAVSVPAQYPTPRALEAGDALICEISAAWWEYAAQLLRTFAIAGDPAPLYRELHDVAEAAFDAVAALLRPGVSAAELVEASRLIEDAGFTIRDDLVHGFVGGYLPPVIGASSRRPGAAPDFTLASGMTIVVQPNVVTRDERAGVQTGELLLVTDTGPERLHAYPRGLLRAPGG